jgi:hypothetical protein
MVSIDALRNRCGTIVTENIRIFPCETGAARIVSIPSWLGWGTLLALVLLTLPLASGAEPPQASAACEVGGKLEFKSRKVGFEGVDVGLIVGDRRFIVGGPDSPQRAVWHCDKLAKSGESPPGDLVIARVTLTSFMLTQSAQKEAVEKGIRMRIRAVSQACPQEPPTIQQKGDWQWSDTTPDAAGKTPRERYEAEVAAWRERTIDVGLARPGTAAWKAANGLADKYGYYEIHQTVQPLDSGRVRLAALLLQPPTPLLNTFQLIATTRQVRTLGLDCDLSCAWDVSVFADIPLPAALIRNALRNSDGAAGLKRPRMSIFVKCETEGMLLGMSEADLKLIVSQTQER